MSLLPVALPLASAAKTSGLVEGLHLTSPCTALHIFRSDEANSLLPLPPSQPARQSALFCLRPRSVDICSAAVDRPIASPHQHRLWPVASAARQTPARSRREWKASRSLTSRFVLDRYHKSHSPSSIPTARFVVAFCPRHRVDCGFCPRSLRVAPGRPRR